MKEERVKEILQIELLKYGAILCFIISVGFIIYAAGYAKGAL